MPANFFGQIKDSKNLPVNMSIEFKVCKDTQHYLVEIEDQIKLTNLKGEMDEPQLCKSANIITEK